MKKKKPPGKPAASDDPPVPHGPLPASFVYSRTKLLTRLLYPIVLRAARRHRRQHPEVSAEQLVDYRIKFGLQCLALAQAVIMDVHAGKLKPEAYCKELERRVAGQTGVRLLFRELITLLRLIDTLSQMNLLLLEAGAGQTSLTE